MMYLLVSLLWSVVGFAAGVGFNHFVPLRHFLPDRDAS